MFHLFPDFYNSSLFLSFQQLTPQCFAFLTWCNTEHFIYWKPSLDFFIVPSPPALHVCNSVLATCLFCLSHDLTAHSHDLNYPWTSDQLTVNTAPVGRQGKCCLSIRLADLWWRLFFLCLFSYPNKTASYLWPLCTSPREPLYLFLICAVYLNLILSFCLTCSCSLFFFFSCGTNIHYWLLRNRLSFFSPWGQTFDYPFIWCVCVCVRAGVCSS